MYSDPSLIREHVVKLNLEDWERDMLEAEAAACDTAVSELVREMILEEAALELNDSNMRLLS